MLIGIPVEKVNAYIDAYSGRNYPRDGMNQEAPDVISGATVTVMVINETIARSTIAAAKAMQGGEGDNAAPAQPKELSVVDMDNQKGQFLAGIDRQWRGAFVSFDRRRGQ